MNTDRKETHFDQSEENTRGSKRCPCWCHVRRVLCEIQGVDGRVQRGKCVVLPMGFGRHGQNPGLL